MRARISGMAAMAAACLLMPAATATAGDSCSGERLLTASGCTSLGEAGRQVKGIVRSVMSENDLRAALVRIDVGDRTIARASPGESITGVPASLRMHTRIGSIAIPYVIDLLLQLQDQGRLSLDDPLSKYFPDLPNADAITLRTLASSTSGYPDWIQENPSFVNDLYGDPFQQFTTGELLAIALNRPLICPPGQCFHYAHTNFVILGKIINQVTGKPVKTLLRQRVLRPLGLDQTEISALPAIPPPALHAYTAARGPYEDSTSWTPSWGIAASMTMTATIGDVVKSAKALGQGTLISREASRERFAPVTAHYPGFSENLYYGLGVLIFNTWQIQNPELNGYTAIQAYLPSERIALGLAVTKGPGAAALTSENYSELLFSRLTDYLSPDHPFDPPGITPPEPVVPTPSG